MPTPLFRLDLTRHFDPVLQLARARPDRVQLVAWAVRYLAQHTGGLDVIIVERPGTLRPVEVLGAAWLDAVRRALGRESFGDVEAVVGRVSEAVEPGPLIPEVTEGRTPHTQNLGHTPFHTRDGFLPHTHAQPPCSCPQPRTSMNPRLLLTLVVTACSPSSANQWSLAQGPDSTVLLTPPTSDVRIASRAVGGRPSHLLALPLDAAPSAPATWFQPRHNRLQQGFTFPTRPPGTGPLTIDVALDGIEGTPHRTARGITWLDGHRVVATYDDLRAWDARGRDLPARLQARCDSDAGDDAPPCRVRLLVDDEDATYPVTVDPLLALGQVPGFHRFDANAWSANGYFFQAQAVTGMMEVWELVGDAVVWRGDLPHYINNGDITAYQGRMAAVYDDGTSDIEEWVLDPTTELFEPAGLLPPPLEPYGYTYDREIFGLDWGPNGLFVVHGFTIVQAGNANIALMDDASGAWTTTHTTRDYLWDIREGYHDRIVSQGDGVIVHANTQWTDDDDILRIRTLSPNGSGGFDLASEVVVDHPGKNIQFPDTPGLVTIESTTASNLPPAMLVDPASSASPAEPDLPADLRHIALSPTGGWLARYGYGDLQVYAIRPGPAVEHYLDIDQPPGTRNWNREADFLSDTHVLVSEHVDLEVLRTLYKLQLPPTLTLTPATVDEGATLPLDPTLLDVLDIDTPDEDLTLELVALPTYGDLLHDGAPVQRYDRVPYADAVAGLLSYAHHGDESTADSFELEACDAELQCSAVAIMDLTIVPVNDPPTPVLDLLEVLEGGAATIDPLANDVDPDSPIDPTATTVGAGSHGTAIADRYGIHYEHDGSETTSDTLTYTVCDVDGACALGSIEVAITPVNDPPTLADGTEGVDEGGSVAIDVLATAADPDSLLDASGLSVLTAPSVGAVTLDASGLAIYAHDGSETTADAFDLQLCDPEGACVTAHFDVVVAPVNDAPVPADDAASVDEGGTVVVDLAANDSDADSSLASATLVAAAAHGTVTIDGFAATYVHDGTETTADAFTYELCDAEGACAQADVTLAITPVDDPPVPTDDAAEVDQGGTVLVDVLANDTDPDSDTLTVLVAAQGAATQATVAGGKVNLVHDGSDTMADTVGLQVCDATSCVDSTLAVTVRSQAGTPTGTPTEPDSIANAGDGGEKGGCGCTSGGLGGGVWMLGVLGLVRRRR